MIHFLMTVDVEEQSLLLNRLDPSVPPLLKDVGMPRLLAVLEKHDVKGTFYFTGTIVETNPELVDMTVRKGHEAGCHGYDHSVDRALDVLCCKDQEADMKKSIDAFTTCNAKPVSFRAPAARISAETLRILERNGYTSDSSISSQRFDGPLTFGSKRKLRWLFAPRGPYYPSNEDVFKRGKSSILEIPISAYISPYIGTTMRASPRAFRFVENRLVSEAKHTGRPIVFLFHPNECLDNVGEVERGRRSDSVIGHAFADVVRQDIKLRNMGADAARLLDRTLTRMEKRGFRFMKTCDFTEKYGEKFREESNAR